MHWSRLSQKGHGFYQALKEFYYALNGLNVRTIIKLLQCISFLMRKRERWTCWCAAIRVRFSRGPCQRDALWNPQDPREGFHSNWPGVGCTLTQEIKHQLRLAAVTSTQGHQQAKNSRRVQASWRHRASFISSPAPGPGPDTRQQQTLRLLFPFVCIIST